jgi:hypothetical protein
MKIFFLAVFVGILLMSSVGAISGVSPSSYTFDFEPGLSKDLEFNFIFDRESFSELYVSGDLAEYVRLDKEVLNGGGTVIASLNLPSEIEISGQHRIRVGAREIAKDNGGVGIASDVGGLIKVNVPYPGRYVEMDIDVGNANIGEDVPYTLRIINLGEEGFEIRPIIEVYDFDDKMSSFELDGTFLEARESEDFNGVLDTSDYFFGDYSARAIADYDNGDFAEAEDSFSMGDLIVEIINYTREFERNKINRMKIGVKNYWNNNIEGLYAEVVFLDENLNLDFTTPFIDLKAWESGYLEGFFDSSEIESVSFKVNVILHYENITTGEIIKLKFAGEIELYWYFVFGAVLAILVGTGIFIWRRWRKKR